MKNILGETNWWLIEKDSDKKIFTVVGPISDDTKYIEKTCSLREQNRNILIETVDIKKSSKIELINEFTRMLKYKYVEYDILEN